MTNYQICNLDEMLEMWNNGNDGFTSPEEYMLEKALPAETAIQMPDEYFEENLGPAPAIKIGETAQLLRNMPGILPPVDCFSKSYVPPKPVNQPDVILNDKIPIYLSKKFFEFNQEKTNENGKTNEKLDDADTKSSDDDNTTVPFVEVEPQKVPEKRYYNAREIYMMKRKS